MGQTLIRDRTLLVVDVEATCWATITPPPGQENEIIQIGLCLIDLTTLHRSDKRSILIRPERSEISPFCTQLTGLTKARLKKQGIKFQEACDLLWSEYDSHKRGWASWGHYDRKLFEAQCMRRNVAYPFNHHYLDAKKAFREVMGEWVTMEHALYLSKMLREGELHQAEDDAWNAAGLIGHLIRNHGNDVLKPLWVE